MKRKHKTIYLIMATFLIFSMISSVAEAAPYTIKSGDNLWQISQKFGTSPLALMRANNLKSSMIYVGQKIEVPDKTLHFVNYGDTLWKISQKYHVSLTDIIKANGLKNPGNLTIGQRIRIPQNTGNSGNSSGGWQAKANALIQAGLKYKGRPYEFGASNQQTRTFDCSSFTQRAFRDIGINIKRSSRSQYTYPPGRHISKSQLRRGDLLFFDYTRDGRIDHVAIFYGPGQLLHTYRNPQGVEVGPFNSYWQTRYVGAKRIIE